MAEYFLKKSGKVSGPFTRPQLISLIREGLVNPEDLVRKGEGGWSPIKELVQSKEKNLQTFAEKKSKQRSVTGKKHHKKSPDQSSLARLSVVFLLFVLIVGGSLFSIWKMGFLSGGARPSGDSVSPPDEKALLAGLPPLYPKLPDLIRETVAKAQRDAVGPDPNFLKLKVNEALQKEVSVYMAVQKPPELAQGLETASDLYLEFTGPPAYGLPGLQILKDQQNSRGSLPKPDLVNLCSPAVGLVSTVDTSGEKWVTGMATGFLVSGLHLVVPGNLAANSEERVEVRFPGKENQPPIVVSGLVEKSGRKGTLSIIRLLNNPGIRPLVLLPKPDLVPEQELLVLRHRDLSREKLDTTRQLADFGRFAGRVDDIQGPENPGPGFLVTISEPASCPGAPVIDLKGRVTGISLGFSERNPGSLDVLESGEIAAVVESIVPGRLKAIPMVQVAMDQRALEANPATNGLVNISMGFNVYPKANFPATLDTFRIEALDNQGTILATGRVLAGEDLVSGTKSTATTGLTFENAGELGKVVRFKLAKVADPVEKAFTDGLEKAVVAGDAQAVRKVMAGFQPKWKDRLDKSLKSYGTSEKSESRAALATLVGMSVDQYPDMEPELVRFLADPDPVVFKSALSALQFMDRVSPTIAKAVIAMAQPGQPGRDAALEALPAVHSVDPEVIRLLVEAANGPDKAIRRATAGALVGTAVTPTEAIGLAKLLVAEKDARSDLVALRIIRQFPGQDRSWAITEVYRMALAEKGDLAGAASKVLGVFLPPKPDDIGVLARMALDKNPVLRLGAVETLGLLGKDAIPAIESVLPALDSADDHLISAALKTLGSMRSPGPSVAARIRKLANAESASIRLAAVQALARLDRSADPVSILLDKLADPSDAVSQAAVFGLANLNPPVGPDDLPALETRLNRLGAADRANTYPPLAALLDGLADPGVAGYGGMRFRLNSLKTYGNQLDLSLGEPRLNTPKGEQIREKVYAAVSQWADGMAVASLRSYPQGGLGWQANKKILGIPHLGLMENSTGFQSARSRRMSTHVLADLAQNKESASRVRGAGPLVSKAMESSDLATRRESLLFLNRTGYTEPQLPTRVAVLVDALTIPQKKQVTADPLQRNPFEGAYRFLGNLARVKGNQANGVAMVVQGPWLVANKRPGGAVGQSVLVSLPRHPALSGIWQVARVAWSHPSLDLAILKLDVDPGLPTVEIPLSTEESLANEAVVLDPWQSEKDPVAFLQSCGRWQTTGKPNLAPEVAALEWSPMRGLGILIDGPGRFLGIYDSQTSMDPSMPILRSRGEAVLEISKLNGPTGPSAVVKSHPRPVSWSIQIPENEEVLMLGLNYLANVNHGGGSLVPMYRRIFSRLRTVQSRAEAARIAEKMGKAGVPLIPDLAKLIGNEGTEGPADSLEQYRNRFLANPANLAVKTALGHLGSLDSASLRELVSLLSSRQPRERFGTLLALESMGAGAKEALPVILRLTQQAQEPNPMVMQQARQTYSKLEPLSKK